MQGWCRSRLSQSSRKSSVSPHGLNLAPRQGDFSSNDVRKYLLRGGKHPMRLFPECFSEDSPIIAITYEWRLTFDDILSYLNPVQARDSHPNPTCPLSPWCKCMQIAHERACACKPHPGAAMWQLSSPSQV